MYAYLQGELVDASVEDAVVDVNGVGYSVHISTASYHQLPEPGSTVRLLVHLYVKEDILQLYGFIDEEERQLFRLLISISGVGPKLALAILSGLQVRDIHESILSNMPERFQGITGVGKKTAARIVLELRDRILKLHPPGSGKQSVRLTDTRVRDDAVSALVTLGFPKVSARNAVAASIDALGSTEVEEVVREALHALQRP